MKNKRLLIFLIIFAVITLFVVLGSTVFTASNIEVSWSTSTNVFSLSDNDEIIESGHFNKSESIFLVNKSKYISTLETSNPYLKVVGIETVFPNKLVIHVAEREVMYALKVAKSEQTDQYCFILLDDELKVLEKSNAVIVPSTTAPIVLEMQNLSITDLDFEVGTTANQLVVTQTLQYFGLSLKEFGYNSVQAKALISSMNFEVATRSTLSVLTNWGITIQVEDATNSLYEKLLKGFSVYTYYHDSNPPVNTGTVLVYATQSGSIEASYVPA